ncbi:MAG: aminotransferase class I/II-fold pyridoxal phosphate-dependent enzyme [Bacteroidota bacterium]
MSQLHAAFSSERFKESAHQIVELLSRFLEQTKDQSTRVIDFHSPDETLEYWRNYSVEDLGSYVNDVIKGSIKVHHPHYIGHQVSAPLPELATLGLVTDLLNNGMGVYEMGSAATAMERIVIEDIAEHIGLEHADGFLTSGGTLGNLTALLAARSRARETHIDSDMYILVSEETHYCAQKAAVTMGFRPDQIVEISTDSSYRMDISDLQEQMSKLAQNDKCIMSVVASACTTSTGSYDDLIAIKNLCLQHRTWLHVDGAHGGAVIYSEKYKHLIDGLDSADSIVIDMHKMLMVPALATAVIFANGKDSYRSFEQKAAYLFAQQEHEWYNLAKRTYETTKLMMSVKCFYLIKKIGHAVMAEFLDRQHDLTRWFARYLVEERTEWEIAHWPMSNILCFRYTPASFREEELEYLNRAIRNQLLDEGQYYIVQTVLRGTYYLRITLMSPMTSQTHLQTLCDHIEELATHIITEHAAYLPALTDV